MKTGCSLLLIFFWLVLTSQDGLANTTQDRNKNRGLNSELKAPDQEASSGTKLTTSSKAESESKKGKISNEAFKEKPSSKSDSISSISFNFIHYILYKFNIDEMFN
ncbi:MAG: hypothetical protein O6939_09535 [Bacteroidetes bacterium]|nr:hypothetical protein [Bacteroidota bacterium]